MNGMEIRMLVENYKKLQLYSVDERSIEESIILEIKQDLLTQKREGWDAQQKQAMLAKVVAYVEFGLCYETYAAMFQQILNLCGITKDMFRSIWNKEAQYVKCSKKNLQKIIIWKTEQKQKYLNKGEVIDEIIALCKKHIYGTYQYKTEKSEYLLEINQEVVTLKNVSKKIIYYLR